MTSPHSGPSESPARAANFAGLAWLPPMPRVHAASEGTWSKVGVALCLRHGEQRHWCLQEEPSAALEDAYQPH